MPPHDGSDLDHATWLNGPEREDEPVEITCAHGHVMGRTCSECSSDAHEELMRAFLRALDKIEGGAA